MIGSPHPFAEEYSRESNEEEAEKPQEEKEQRKVEREERERKVKVGELVRFALIPDHSKLGDILIRYYDPHDANKHYVLTPSGGGPNETENPEKKERVGEKLKKIGGSVVAAAALIPLGSSNIVILGQENLLAQIVNLFTIIKTIIGGLV